MALRRQGGGARPAALLAAALVAALLVASPQPTSAQGVLAGEKLIHATGWNTGGNSRWTLVVKDCTPEQVAAGACAKAGVVWNSTRSAYTGVSGARVTINANSSAAWHVQFKSPVFAMNPDLAYTLCLWVRGTSSTNRVKFGAIRVAGNTSFSTLADKMIPVGTSWKRFCVPEMNYRQNQTDGFFALDLGLIAGPFPFALSFDDVQVTTANLTAARLWASDAAIDARIEAIRKGSFALRFQLPGGASARVTDLSATLTKHSFAVGTCMEVDSRYDVNIRDWVRDTWNASTKAWFLDVVENTIFNTIVNCNRFKW